MEFLDRLLIIILELGVVFTSLTIISFYLMLKYFEPTRCENCKEKLLKGD